MNLVQKLDIEEFISNLSADKKKMEKRDKWMTFSD